MNYDAPDEVRVVDVSNHGLYDLGCNIFDEESGWKRVVGIKSIPGSDDFDLILEDLSTKIVNRDYTLFEM